MAAPAPESKALAGGPDRHGRVLGLDLGNVRVGVALSSSDRRVALAHAVLAGGEPTALVAAVSRLCAEHDVALVVVGVPYGLSGARTARARQAEALIATLADQLEIPVVGADERLSTVEAEQARRIALTARDRARRRGRGGRAGAANRRRQPVLDAEAAAVVLQAYLDAQRHRFGGEA